MKITFRRVALLLVAALPLMLCAKTAREQVADTPEKAGGVYFAYPENEISPDYGSKAPKGYVPFYASHYGRHGSRYLIDPNDYLRPSKRLADAEKAGVLSPAGKELKALIDTAAEEARQRYGELTPLGMRQHKGIARRMATAYPEIFAGYAEVTAASTAVMRCAHSMFAFLEALKEINPSLEIPRESSVRNKWYLSNHEKESAKLGSQDGPWYQDYKRFRNSQAQADRFTAQFFIDPAYVEEWIDPQDFMWDIYWLAVDAQNTEANPDFIKFFTNDELYRLWEVHNYQFYACNSSYPRANGLHTDNARNLVGHIVDNADKAIASGSHGATLRFGHDGNIIPLLALMKIDGCYSDAVAPADLAPSGYANFNISPMAANIQLIFFRNKKDANDILVRVYVNERDAEMPVAHFEDTPYYRWSDLRPYLANLMPHDNGQE